MEINSNLENEKGNSLLIWEKGFLQGFRLTQTSEAFVQEVTDSMYYEINSCLLKY